MKKYVNRQHVSLALALFVLYLAIVFWPHFAKWCTTIFAAMTPLLIGAVIAYIVNLLLRKYEQLYRRLFKGPRAKKFQRLWGIFLSYLSIFLILAIVIRLVIPELISCVQLLINNHSKVITRFITAFEHNSNLQEVFKQFDVRHLSWSKAEKVLSYGFSGTVKALMSTASSVVSVATTSIVAFFFSIYLLIYKEMLARQCTRLIDAYLGKIKRPLMYVIRTFDNCYSNYIAGQCKDAAILGIACFIGMSILRMPYATMIGVVTAIGALIPIIGGHFRRQYRGRAHLCRLATESRYLSYLYHRPAAAGQPDNLSAGGRQEHWLTKRLGLCRGHYRWQHFRNPWHDADGSPLCCPLPNHRYRCRQARATRARVGDQLYCV